jgi:ABC-type sugar transport system ATPase subunit
MNVGWIQQIDTPENIYDYPENVFVAGFIGAPAMNFINGVYSKGVVTLENEVKPNGSDIALFTCECVDENGNVVPTASELVSFSVSTEDGLVSKETGEFVKVNAGARAVIVGTGSDNTDHNNVKNNTRQMYMGKISVAVKPGKDQKKLILNARSSNIGFGKIVVEF